MEPKKDPQINGAFSTKATSTTVSGNSLPTTSSFPATDRSDASAQKEDTRFELADSAFEPLLLFLPFGESITYMPIPTSSTKSSI